MASKPQSAWHSAANPSQNQLGGEPNTGSGRRYIITPEKRRMLAMRSTEGGVAYCEKCKVRFSMGYMRYVRVSAFCEGYCCVDCVKQYSLQKA